MSGFIGDSIMDCRLWLFSDSDFAGEYVWKSTTGCAMFLVGPDTYYPLNAFSKKQTSITMSSTESEVVAANHGLRAEGLPCLASGTSSGVGMPAARPSLGLRKGIPLLHALTLSFMKFRMGQHALMGYP